MHTESVALQENQAGSYAAGLKFSTADVPFLDRGQWWKEVICRQYANVDITSPITYRFTSETTIYPWQQIQLSQVRSSSISIRRLPGEPRLSSQDGYFAVLLLSGDYLLEQDGREVFLQPGDLAIYDATRPHRIHCPRDFSKLIFSVPRTVMRQRVAAVESCTAIRIAGDVGVGAVASHFLRTTAGQVQQMRSEEFYSMSDNALDMLAVAAASIRPTNFYLSNSQSLSLHRVKAFIDAHLQNPALDPGLVSQGVRLSPRYIRRLFESERTSLMRYVLHARLEKCRMDIEKRNLTKLRISEIAFRWGFNELSHFSRSYKARFGASPREHQTLQKT